MLLYRMNLLPIGTTPAVLVSGSHMAAYVCMFKQIWDKMFVPLHCLNFGIGSDQTQQVLWRVQNGELDNFLPKVSYFRCVFATH